MMNSLKMTSDKTTHKLAKYNKVYVADADVLTPGLQLGLFASKPLRKGETIFIAKGRVVPLVIKTKEDSQKLPNAIGLEPGVWLDPYEKNPLVYLNHSCDPNAGIKGRVTITALKPIKKGEHITIDYSTTECDEKWILDKNCKCGAKNCRGVIKSIQSLPKSTYTKYIPYIPHVFQREYRKKHAS